MYISSARGLIHVKELTLLYLSPGYKKQIQCTEDVQKTSYTPFDSLIYFTFASYVQGLHCLFDFY